MRGLAYGIAAIAAIGIMIAIANTGGRETDTGTMKEAGTLTLAVPEMHCSFSCFPRVKKTLESNPTVAKVELGPQKVKDAIDNRQVIIHYQAGFDVQQSLNALSKEGFTESQVVQ